MKNDKRISAETLPKSELIGTLKDGTKVYEVDGAYVRDTISTAWIGGGHGWQDAFIPMDEIWVEETPEEHDYQAIFVHEVTEYILMRYGSWEYNKAHDMANSVEAILRGNKQEQDEASGKGCGKWAMTIPGASPKPPRMPGVPQPPNPEMPAMRPPKIIGGVPNPKQRIAEIMAYKSKGQ